MSNPDVPTPVGTSNGPVTTAPRRARWLPAVLIVVGVGCLIAAVPLFRHGVVTHAFPSYVQNDPSYEVARWSAPWIAGSLALGGVGVLSLLIAGGRLLSRPPRVPVVHRPADVSQPSGLEPRPTEAAREY